jgi:hypothetical protein
MTLSFPDNWTPGTTTSQQATHCFINQDNNDKIIITVKRFAIKDRIKMISYSMNSISDQLFAEKYHMVEQNVTVQVLNNPNGIGYYFMATDTITPTEWPFLMRCMYVGKTTAFSLTVLCQDKNSPTIGQTFDLMKNMDM